MLIILPEWTLDFEEKLDRFIKEFAAKKHIDLTAVEDSISIKNGIESISNALVRLYENYDLEGRRMLEEVEKSWNESKTEMENTEKALEENDKEKQLEDVKKIKKIVGK